MEDNLYRFILLLALAGTILGLISGIAAAWLPYLRSAKAVRRAASLLLLLAGLGLAAGLLTDAAYVGIGIRGSWWAVEGMVLTVLPLLLAVQLGVGLLTMPRLARLRRMPEEEIVRPDVLADPWLTVPLLAGAAGSGLHLVRQLFAQPVLPGLTEILLSQALAFLLGGIPLVMARRRHRLVLAGRGRVKAWQRLLKHTGFVAAGAAVVMAVFVVYVVAGGSASKLPEAYDMMNHDGLDEGGGTPTQLAARGEHAGHGAAHGGAGVEVAELTGDISAPADVRFELTAQRTELTLASGAKVEAWTYNGEAVPELRVKEGQMVEVVLANRDVEAGVSIHWHGYDVPNAMDGIPGMTQNAVKPGESFRYKFRAKQTGTYWFHSHQQSSEQVEKGLFGRLIVEPAEEPSPYDVEETVVLHRWKTDRGYRTAFGLEDGTRTLQIPPGRTVRLRMINTDNLSRVYLLQGTPYAVTAIDGTPIRQAALLPENTSFRIGSGGRYDLTFRMPDGSVYLKTGAADDPEGPLLVLSPESNPPAPVFQQPSGSFDPGSYGLAAENEVTAKTAKFDREFRMIFGNRMGFYNGVFHFLWTINGRVLPDTPTFVVKEGEKVKMTFVNRSLTEHPMHLHGHHMTVLKHNGKRVATPWITDTLNVAPGDTYEVGFVADNPGMWMDHCHNLYHAATGMILHLMYDGVRPSYEAGTRSGNLPD